jgi:hypothetical protein
MDLFYHLPNTLQHLNLYNCYLIGWTALATLRRNCPYLRTLIMHNIGRMSTAAEFCRLFDDCPKLEVLVLDYLFEEPAPSKLNKIGKLHSLKQLIFCDFHNCTDGLVETICGGCRELEVLVLSKNSKHSCNGLNNGGFQGIAN